MTDVIAIDWESHRISGIQADVSRGSARIQKCFTLPVAKGTLEGEAAGLWLKGELQRQGTTARQLMVSIPREDVVVRYLELPPCSDDELPAMVRFQSAAKSTIPVDQLALDFLPLPPRASVEGREVLVASLPVERVRRLQKMATEAGLELLSIGVSSVATAELVIQAEQAMISQPGEVTLIVARHADRVEISVLDRGVLAFTHSSQTLADEGASAVLGETSRALVALQKRMSDLRVTRCWLIGSDHENVELAQGAQDRFRCQVHRLDPFRAQGVTLSISPVSDAAGAFGGPIGQLISHSTESARRIDFLNPRRPAVKRDHTKIRKMAAAAAAVIVFGSLFAYRSHRVSQLKDETAQLQSQLKDTQNNLNRMAPQVKVAEAVKEWSAGRMNTLNEVNQLAVTMDGTDRRYLTRLVLSEGTRNELGTISGGGLARERFDVEGLNAELMNRPDVQVNAKEVKRSGKDGEYPYQFELDVHLKRPVPEAAKTDAKKK